MYWIIWIICINDNMVCVYRKAIDDSEYKTHFDYFSVDFSEEYSAIYGGVLELQADYLRQAGVHIIPFNAIPNVD